MVRYGVCFKRSYYETFEKCSILFKFKEGENFNHPDEIGTGIHALSILRINPPEAG
jgi:hypothetical protein